MNLPIYKLVISDDDTDTTGVQAIALVDSPAIKMNWMAFAKQQQFKTTNPEKKIISGPLMVADQLIYRKDDQLGEYNVMFDAPTIFKIVQKYFRQGNTSDVNLMHNDSMKAKGVYMIESFIIDKERGISTPKGFEKLSEGSWFGSFKVDNQQIWDDFINEAVADFVKCKNGHEFNYNSIEESGMVYVKCPKCQEPVCQFTESDMQKVKDLLQNRTK